MKIKDIMTKEPEVVSPESMICMAASKMKQCDIGMLPVCDGQRLVGCITDRDLAIRAVADGADPFQTPVKQVMSSHLFYCFEDDDLEAAAQLMEEKQVRRLPVLNREKRLVGIVSLGDFALRSQDEHLTEEL